MKTAITIVMKDHEKYADNVIRLYDAVLPIPRSAIENISHESTRVNLAIIHIQGQIDEVDEFILYTKSKYPFRRIDFLQKAIEHLKTK